MENNQTIEDIQAKTEKAKSLDRLWYFRRSAGQPGIIALSYGLISASVAELTGGILYTSDGAWDYQRFPAESVDFLDWYFKPEKAIKDEHGDWANRCIQGIQEELFGPEPRETAEWRRSERDDGFWATVKRWWSSS